MKKLKMKALLCFGVLVAFSLLPSVVAGADDAPAVTGIEKPTTEAVESAKDAAPQSDLDKLKMEWEAVREQQIQMIREKEDQLEKLKEEIFAKMKALNVAGAPSPAAVPSGPSPILPVDASSVAALETPSEFEAQKEAFLLERQKFFKEMSRQRENLLKAQASLDEKTKQLEAERQEFESKKTAALS